MGATKQMRVMFPVDIPDVRTAVIAAMLKECGSHVSLVTTCSDVAIWARNIFSEVIVLNRSRDVVLKAESFDVALCSNITSRVQSYVLASSIPVVLDHNPGELNEFSKDKDDKEYHGIISLSKIFAVAASGHIYMSKQHEAKGVRLLNGILRSFIPERIQFGAPDSKGKTAVLLGDFGSGKSPLPIKTILEMSAAGLTVNVYFWNKNIEYEKMLIGIPNVNSHVCGDFKSLIYDLSGYDFAVACSCNNSPESGPCFCTAFLLAAGLPLVVHKGTAEDALAIKHSLGLPIDQIIEWNVAISKLLELKRSTEIRCFSPICDSAIDSLGSLFRKTSECLRGSVGKDTGSVVRGKCVVESSLEHAGREYEKSKVGCYDLYSLRARRMMILTGEIFSDIYRDEVFKAVERFAGEHTEDIIELGYAGLRVSDYLHSKRQIMVLGIDVGDHTKESSAPQSVNGLFWDIPCTADMVVAADILHLMNESQINEVLRSVSANSFRAFFTVPFSPRNALEDQCMETHYGSHEWHQLLLKYYSSISSRKIENAVSLECESELPSLEPELVNSVYQSWNTKTGKPVTPYREHWNRHASTLSWKGTVLYIGSNALCRNYYDVDFFGCDQVLHIDPDPINEPDVVTIGEDLSHFADNSVDGIAFFGTPYVMDCPSCFIEEALRVLKPGGVLSGAFNGDEARWDGRKYTPEITKSRSEQWVFTPESVFYLFKRGFFISYSARTKHEYYYITAIKEVTA